MKARAIDYLKNPCNQSDLDARIDQLAALSLDGLRAAWRAEFRRDPPKGLYRDLLLRTLAWRLQEKAFGGHDKATLKLLDAYARGKGDSPMFRRLKSGTVLIREYQGTRYTVTITPEGYVWDEKTYASLTPIARAITGSNWNGPKFFGLRVGGGKKDASTEAGS